MKYLVWTLLVVLVVLHQDYWQWNDASLVFGFLPSSLVHHACISIAAALVWWLATQSCWPAGLNEIEPADVQGESVE